MRIGKKKEEKVEVKGTGPEILVRKTWTLDKFKITKEDGTITIRDTQYEGYAYVITFINFPESLAAQLADILLQAAP